MGQSAGLVYRNVIPVGRNRDPCTRIPRLTGASPYNKRREPYPTALDDILDSFPSFVSRTYSKHLNTTDLHCTLLYAPRFSKKRLVETRSSIFVTQDCLSSITDGDFLEPLSASHPHTTHSLLPLFTSTCLSISTSGLGLGPLPTGPLLLHLPSV